MAKKKAEVRYVAMRFIDRLMPGDEVPADVYDEDHLKRMVEANMIRQEVDGRPEVIETESAVSGETK